MLSERIGYEEAARLPYVVAMEMIYQIRIDRINEGAQEIHRMNQRK